VSAARPLVVLSNIIIDDVWLADGTHQGQSVGGAAVWAAIGARAWWPQVGIAAGVGADLAEVTAGQLRDFGLLADGETVRHPNTIQSRLVYLQDGSRTETPAYGPDHFGQLQLTPADIAPTLLPAAGTYIFRDLWPQFWQAFGDHRQKLGYTFWELQHDIAAPKHWPVIRALLPALDIVSLNQAEAFSLFGDRDPVVQTRELLKGGARVVVVRMGANGALISTPKESVRVTPPRTRVTDVTGAGNAFCGGFLAGWCIKPGDIEYASRCAAGSAALAIAQIGLPPRESLNSAPRLATRTHVTRIAPIGAGHAS
jgi:sugar/nucleoside kinase (ribokinase family)